MEGGEEGAAGSFSHPGSHQPRLAHQCSQRSARLDISYRFFPSL